MRRISLQFTCVLLIAAGCSQPSGSGANGNGPGSVGVAAGTPDKVVYEFLEAVRTGNDQKTAAMLTPLARKKTAEAEMAVAPPGSPTAKFQVGEVEYVTPEKDGAHVWSRWTDVVDDQGHTRTDELIWVLRKEEEGWRIAGMVTKVYPNQPPLVLNFEDPQDMSRKQQLLHQMDAAMQGGTAPAGQPQATLPEKNAPSRE